MTIKRILENKIHLLDVSYVGVWYFEDWTGLDWTSKTRTSKTRTSKMRTYKTRTSKTRTYKTRTSKTRTSKTRTSKTRTGKTNKSVEIVTKRRLALSRRTIAYLRWQLLEWPLAWREACDGKKYIVRKIFLFYLGGLSMLDVYGYVCNVYAYIRIQIIVEIKTIIEALVRVLPVRVFFSSYHYGMERSSLFRRMILNKRETEISELKSQQKHDYHMVTRSRSCFPSHKVSRAGL